MVLAAQEVGTEVRVSSDGVHGALGVGVVLGILGDLGHDVGIAGQRVHNVLDGGDVVSAGSSADPSAAPVIRLRALADCIVAEDTVANFLFAAFGLRSSEGVAQQGEVDAPGAVEEAEHLTGRALVSSPLVAPQAGLVVVTVVGVGLGLVDPAHDVGVNLDGGAVHPTGGHVVGEGAVRIIVTREHLVALGSGLLSHGVELIPIAQSGLDFGRVIGAQHILGDAAAVCEQARGRLPGGALLDAIDGNDVLGVLVLILQVVIGQADIALDVQRVVGVNILQSVVSFDQEDVDLIVVSGGILFQQGFVKLVLVVVVIVGVDGPLHGNAIVQLGGGLIVCHRNNAGIIVVEAGLELVVPAPDVQDLALLGGCLGICPGGGAGLGRGRVSGGCCGRACGAPATTCQHGGCHCSRGQQTDSLLHNDVFLLKKA